MTTNPVYFEQDDLLEGTRKFFFKLLILLLDFRFEPYISHLRNGDLPLPSTITNNIEPVVGDLMTLPP
jgi:hypothetical protein